MLTCTYICNLRTCTSINTKALIEYSKWCIVSLQIDTKTVFTAQSHGTNKELHVNQSGSEDNDIHSGGRKVSALHTQKFFIRQ
jgi:hypothetical protein